MVLQNVPYACANSTALSTFSPAARASLLRDQTGSKKSGPRSMGSYKALTVARSR